MQQTGNHNPKPIIHQLPFQPVPSPFGTGIDEQTSTANFEQLVGGVARAQRLLRIFKDSTAGTDHRGRPISRRDVYRRRALAQGFTAVEADALLSLQ